MKRVSSLSLVVLYLMFAMTVWSHAEERAMPPLPEALPLDVEYPLLISLDNSDQWIDNPEIIEKEKMIIDDFLKAHTFPWMELLILTVFGGLGWVLYLTKEGWYPQLFPRPVVSNNHLEEVRCQLKDIKNAMERQEKIDPFVFSHILRLLITTKKKVSALEMTQEEMAVQLAPIATCPELSLLIQIEKALFSGKGLSIDEIKIIISELDTLIPS